MFATRLRYTATCTAREGIAAAPEAPTTEAALSRTWAPEIASAAGGSAAAVSGMGFGGRPSACPRVTPPAVSLGSGCSSRKVKGSS